MLNSQNLSLLLENFRLQEAISMLSNYQTNNNPEKNNLNQLKDLINSYDEIIKSSKWELFQNELKNLKNNVTNKNILEEYYRISNLIVDWLNSNRKILLYFTSAYYAMANENSVLFKQHIKKIREMLSSELNYETLPIEKQPLGGYEEMDFLNNYLTNNLALKTSAFETIKELSISVNACLN